MTRNEAESIFKTCIDHNWRRIALLGDGDLVEIFAMSALDKEITLALYGNTDTHNLTLAELPRLASKAQLRDFDCVIICDMNDPIQLNVMALELFQKERVLAPAFLGIDKHKYSAISQGVAP